MKRYGRKTAQGVWQPPDLCAMVTAWFRQRRNTRPRSAAGRIKRHMRLVANVTDCSRVQRLCQQLLSGIWPGDRVLPHTAFVLTWFKIKKRQASASRTLRTMERFCCKGFRHCSLSELLRFLWKSSGNGRMCQGVNCAYLN